MRRIHSLLLVGAVAAYAVACRESSVAPASAPESTESAALASTARGRDKSTTLLATMDISPNGGTYSVGDFQLVFPAGAVCDPATTRYGSRYWNDDCTPLRRSITVKVVAESRGGRISVDFQPDLRFRPNAGWVTIQTNAYRDVLTNSGVRALSPDEPAFRYFGILYVPTGGRSRIDEVSTTGDRSMVTYVDRNTGLVWRRIKHFSGFTLSSGFSCTTTDDGVASCTSGGLGGISDPLAGASMSNSVVDASSIIVTP
jgi:hypothetical protein